MPAHDESIQKIDPISIGSNDQQADKAATRSLDVSKQENFQRIVSDKEALTLQSNQNAENAAKRTVFDESAKNSLSSSPLSRDQIIAQADKISQRIEEVKEALSMENASIKSGYKTQLEGKLKHINETLRIAIDKSGGEAIVAEGTKTPLSPAQKFIGQLSHAQFQLDSLGSYLEAMSEKTQSMSPANMMAIQLKVYAVQQEVELFTNMLNKGLEGMKTIMNVQV